MKSKITESKYCYPILISIIWFLVYITSQLILDQKLGWDETTYLAVAKGIVEDFNFSSRQYTIMGLLKCGYPTHFINLPAYSMFLAIVIKLFGTSLKTIYFFNWLFALGISFFIYLIFNILSDDNKKVSFFVSISYILCPGMLRLCDTAMMEQSANFLLCLFVYLILRDYKKGVIDYFTAFKFAFAFLILWIFKSLYIGIFFGAFVLILLTYNSKITENKLRIKIPVFPFLSISYGLFIVMYLLVKKFVFLPVASMMNFSQDLESKQLYADFLAGFFQSFPDSFIHNIKIFFTYILGQYFVIPTTISNPQTQFLMFIPYIAFTWLYFFLFFIAIACTFSGWKKLNTVSKLFVIFTVVSILSFNVIFNVLFSSTYENIWRYNIYYLPLYLCFLGLVAFANFDYKKLFVQEHPNVVKVICSISFAFIYVPLFLSVLLLQSILWNDYHQVARGNDEFIQSVIGNDNPRFIYFNDGIHTFFTRYPIQQVFKDATNEQLLKVNDILPEPIEYLFLRPSDWLFKNNQEQILASKPILDGKYKLIGFNQEKPIVVYQYSPG